MGAYLSSPVTHKETHGGKNDQFEFGVCAMQGWRTDMEDAHLVVLDLNQHDTSPTSKHVPASLFGVFDGHGGKEVALFCASHLPHTLTLSQGYREDDMALALEQTFLQMDELMTREEHKAELKALKGGDEDEDSSARGRDKNGSMTIDSSQIPNALLEALGVPEDSGCVFKIVKTADGQMQIDDITSNDDGDVLEEEEDAGVAAADNAGASTTGTNKKSQDTKRDGKRKKTSDKSQQLDGPFSNVPRDKEADEDEDNGVANEIIIEDLNKQEEEEWFGPSAGCTAVCAMIRSGNLYVANAGDSRCVLSRDGKAIAMSHDHKPTDEEEFARITKAGGFVADGRVNGSLNLSRALGDLEYKLNQEMTPQEQMVTALPEVRTLKIEEGDEFFILACDGIWDVLSNQEAVDFARERLLEGRSAEEICEDMCDHCLAPDTGGCGKGCDNMSVVLAVFKESEFGKKVEEQRK